MATPDCLVVTRTHDPALWGKRFDLDKDLIRVGRSPSNDILLTGDSVSRHQAHLERRAGTWIVVDDQSCGGTRLNDELIHSEAAVKDGDAIGIGSTVLVLLSGPDVMARYEEEVVRLRSTDPLTGIHNKRHLYLKLQREIDRGAGVSGAAAIVTFDIDHFKHINTLHGFLGGDFVLRELALVVQARLRREHVFARYGGEEFAIFLPETALEGAVALAETLRRSVSEHIFVVHAEAVRVTLSAGVTRIREGERAAQDVMARADEQMVRAKDEGRNRVCW